DQHLLVVGGRQVEDSGRPGARRTGARPPAACAGERAAGGGGDPETVAGGREHHLLRLLAQTDPIDEVAHRQTVDGCDGQADGVTRLARRQAVATAGAHGIEEGHDPNVTPSYKKNHIDTPPSGHHLGSCPCPNRTTAPHTRPTDRCPREGPSAPSPAGAPPSCTGPSRR